MITYTVKIKPLSATAKLPSFKSEGAAAMDIYAPKAHTIQNMETMVVPCGFAMEVPASMEVQIRPRSGLSKRGIMVAFGTIDSDYRGEFGVIMTNISGGTYEIEPNDRIAQLVMATNRTPYARFSVVEHLTNTERGEGGFGSTGR